LPQAIAYCDRCARLVPPGARKDALISGETILCSECASALSPEERAEFVGAPAPAAASPKRPSRTRTQPQARHESSATRTRKARPSTRITRSPHAQEDSGGRLPPAIRQNLPIIVLSLSGIFVGVTFGLLFMGGDDGGEANVSRPDRAGGPGANVATNSGGGGSGPLIAPVPEGFGSSGASSGSARAGGAPSGGGATSARLQEITGWIDADLGDYTKVRKALVACLAANPSAPDAAEAKRLLADVDGRYAKSAEEALELAIVVGKGVAGTGDFRVAESGVRSIANRFGEGPWLETTGKAKIEQALAEIEKIRDLRLAQDDPGNGIPPDQDTLARHVPEAKDYKLVYDLDLGKLGREPRYFVDDSRKVEKFDRVAYLIELYAKADGEPEFLYVSMKAFTSDARLIGVPTLQAGAKFQRAVEDMTVVSNVDGIRTGSGLSGWIEFWSSNYASKNSAGVPGASDREFDFGDMPNGGPDGYGSMQVHNPGAQQTLFAINKWKAGRGADVGIGNSEGKTRDWTFTGKASQWPRKRLRVLVK
jgi:hypothetical protein